MIRLLPILLLMGCAQTAHVLSPATAECIAECSPEGGCKVKFILIEETGTDSSILSVFNKEDTENEDD